MRFPICGRGSVDTWNIQAFSNNYWNTVDLSRCLLMRYHMLATCFVCFSDFPIFSILGQLVTCIIKRP